jgi:hypothetical protein
VTHERTFHRSIILLVDDSVTRPQSATCDRHVAIIGPGDVGLPLCLAFARNGAVTSAMSLAPKKTDGPDASRS